MAPCVDLSTFQRETGALVELTKDTIFYRGVLAELNQPQLQPTPLYGDNDSTISVAINYDGNHKRICYMLLMINWMMEQIKTGVCKIFRLHTKDLQLDELSKNIKDKSKRGNYMGLQGPSDDLLEHCFRRGQSY